MVFLNLKQAMSDPMKAEALKIDKDDLISFSNNAASFVNLRFLVINNKKWVIVNYDGRVDTNTVIKITLPNSIVKLKNLKALILINYYIDHLPNDISSLTKLESLKLAFTHDANLAIEINKIKSIKNIREVDLSNSLITPKLIKEEFKDSPQIKLLLVHGDIEPKY